MPETDFSAFGLSEAEADDIGSTLKSYCQRFDIDERDDAVSDGWFAVLTFPYESPPPGWPSSKKRHEQIAYLKTVARTAAARFVNRHAYDAPLSTHGNSQTIRMTHHIPE